ncbi:MAG TPA: DUF502 domain-containing protein [Sedimentisphaerales bacterium]|nr:DUF502 domain-containing protein [Sedimentisphaerales bacterium]
MAGRFKTYFLRGLAVLLPTVVAIGILVWAFSFVNDNISGHIKGWLETLIIWAGGSKEELAKDWIQNALTAAGFLLALVAVLIVGALLATVVGKTLWRMVEKFIMNTPLLRSIYPSVKQVTDFLLTEEDQKRLFKRVVAIEYPRDGIWSIGFVTGSGLTKVADNLNQELFTVLVPTSPTPFTGFVVMVPKKNTIDLGITVEEAFRFIVTGGVVTPAPPRPVPLPHGQINNTKQEPVS